MDVSGMDPPVALVSGPTSDLLAAVASELAVRDYEVHLPGDLALVVADAATFPVHRLRPAASPDELLPLVAATGRPLAVAVVAVPGAPVLRSVWELVCASGGGGRLLVVPADGDPGHARRAVAQLPDAPRRPRPERRATATVLTSHRRLLRGVRGVAPAGRSA